MKLNNGDWFCKKQNDEWIILEVNEYIEAYGYKLDDVNLIKGKISVIPSQFDFNERENKDFYILHNLSGPAFIKFQNESHYYIDGVEISKQQHKFSTREQKLKRII